MNVVNLFRCERLPEESIDYDYYAIDIANRQEIENYITQLFNLIGGYEILDTIPSCLFLNTTVFLATFPPCNPATLKLRPICESQCFSFFMIVANCFGDAIEKGIMIAEFAQLYDTYDCTNVSTHIQGVGSALFDSQINCYNVSVYNIRGKCILLITVCTNFIET